MALVRSSSARRICSCAFLSVASARAAAHAVLLRERAVELACSLRARPSGRCGTPRRERALEIRLDRVNVSDIFAACFFAMRPSFRLGESHRSITPFPARTMHACGLLKRIALGSSRALAAIAYVWVAAVRAAPGVRRRKAESRARRRAAPEPLAELIDPLVSVAAPSRAGSRSSSGSSSSRRDRASLESELGLPWDVLNQGLAEQLALVRRREHRRRARRARARLGARRPDRARDGRERGPGRRSSSIVLLALDAVDALVGQPLAVRIALLVGGIAVVAARLGVLHLRGARRRPARLADARRRPPAGRPDRRRPGGARDRRRRRSASRSAARSGSARSSSRSGSARRSSSRSGCSGAACAADGSRSQQSIAACG